MVHFRIHFLVESSIFARIYVNSFMHKFSSILTFTWFEDEIFDYWQGIIQFRFIQFEVFRSQLIIAFTDLSSSRFREFRIKPFPLGILNNLCDLN